MASNLSRKDTWGKMRDFAKREGIGQRNLVGKTIVAGGLSDASASLSADADMGPSAVSRQQKAQRKALREHTHALRVAVRTTVGCCLSGWTLLLVPYFLKLCDPLVQQKRYSTTLINHKHAAACKSMYFMLHYIGVTILMGITSHRLTRFMRIYKTEEEKDKSRRKRKRRTTMYNVAACQSDKCMFDK